MIFSKHSHSSLLERSPARSYKFLIKLVFNKKVQDYREIKCLFYEIKQNHADLINLLLQDVFSMGTSTFQLFFRIEKRSDTDKRKRSRGHSTRSGTPSICVSCVALTEHRETRYVTYEW